MAVTMKTCCRCGTEYPATAEFFSRDRNRPAGLRSACKKCISAESSHRYSANREHLQAIALSRYGLKKADPTFRQGARQRSKRSRDKQREICIQAYGGHCECCGEDRFEFLAIDHINGGGGKHRKELGSGAAIPRWLIKNNFPPGFRILCHNCNMAMAIYGECPHQRDKQLRAV